jgi:hypothetical protein
MKISIITAIILITNAILTISFKSINNNPTDIHIMDQVGYLTDIPIPTQLVVNSIPHFFQQKHLWSFPNIVTKDLLNMKVDIKPRNDITVAIIAELKPERANATLTPMQISKTRIKSEANPK